MAKSFSLIVADWAKKVEAEQIRILHEAARLLVEEMTRPESEGGHMPVETGNLRKSVAVSPAGWIRIEWLTKKFRDPSNAVANAIAGIEIGTTAYIGFRAPYARKVEMETGFVRLAAQRWRAIVDEAVKIKR